MPDAAPPWKAAIMRIAGLPVDDSLNITPHPSAARPLRNGHDNQEIIGDSDGMRYVLSRAEQVAETDATVLLLGETGTGKELVARAIHRRSRRRERPFVVVNCAALPATIIESELFGRERGAFTGAHTTQIGRFELAHHGTIFLDEIGELPLELQPKLLRALETGQIERLGSPHTVDVDMRLIAATNRDLLEEVRQGRFRADLYYRLNVFPITMPALRERRDDIPPLVRHLVGRLGRVLQKRIDVIPPPAMRALESYDWPGNVRELENVLQRAIILSGSGVLALTDPWHPASDHLPSYTNGSGTLIEVERRHIVRVLEGCRWRIEGPGGSAQILGLKPSTLRSRMLKLGIARPR
jgi:transcriptional regulator with GAF, ATPase, and Fis domain